MSDQEDDDLHRGPDDEGDFQGEVVDDEWGEEEGDDSPSVLVVGGHRLSMALNVNARGLAILAWREAVERLGPPPTDMAALRARGAALATAGDDAIRDAVRDANTGLEWALPSFYVRPDYMPEQPLADELADSPTGGPGMSPEEIVLIVGATAGGIFGTATALAAAYNTWVQFGKNLRSAAPALQALADRMPWRHGPISDGLAMMIAASAAYDESGLMDLTLGFVTETRPRTRERYADSDCYTVAFRGVDTIWMAVVDKWGRVRAVTSAELPGLLRAPAATQD